MAKIVHTLGLIAWTTCCSLVCRADDAAAGRVTGSGADPEREPFSVLPRQGELLGPLARVQLIVASPTGADLTCSVTYESSTPDLLRVDETGRVRPLASGDGVVRVMYGGRRVSVPFTVRGAEQRENVSFRHDVIPILTRGGCNSGACHAAQYGKGGFKLSLLGFAPDQDHPEIARSWLGRRVSLARPEESLLLLKPTLGVPHGGGRRFRTDSYEYEVLLAWLRGGARGPRDDEPVVVSLEVTPRERVYIPGERQQLRVVATHSDGSRSDVTHRALYDSTSEAIARVTDHGHVTAAGRGQAPIMVRYLGQAEISMVIVPFAPEVELPDFRPNNVVDELVRERWRRLGLRPSSVCSDEEFVRRAFLDALGTLPTPERVRAFLSSDDAKKREALVDELLGLTGDPSRDVYVNEWSAYWALKWGDLIRNNRTMLGDGGMWALYNWIRGSLRENKPVDQFVRELITAQGSVFQSGPANYYKIATRPEDLAEATAQSFLGVRLQCARCHHHPFEVYSQADYYGLAAFFTRVGNKGSNDFGALGGDSVVLVKRSGSIRHPRTRKVLSPTPLGGEPIDSDRYRDVRRPLAEWLTSPGNRLFARNIVNRFWGYLMGTGLVEPIDDMRATNPPSNPALLDRLADEFVESGFDLRHLMRVIMTSSAYGLSSRPRPENAADTRFYTHYNLKRLPAEVLLDAIDFACGTRERFSGIPEGTRAIELPDPNYSSYFLDTLGRPRRVVTCECERTTEPNLGQVLHIANGQLLSGKIAAKGGRVATLLASGLEDAGIIEELYLCTFSRSPTEAEVRASKEVIARAADRREGFEDILWALSNSREFLLNH